MAQKVKKSKIRDFKSTYYSTKITKEQKKPISDYFNTTQEVIFGNSNDMNLIDNNSINLVCTSPPYCMIEMWDEIFCNLNSDIKLALDEKDGLSAFELMHQELDKTWDEVDRVTADNGIVCINVGDATRKIGDDFQLFLNHTRIANFFMKTGYQALPPIIWSKPSNKPTKFMGSGMYPGGAYVTLELEYILIFRKGGKRSYSNIEKIIRRESSYFWEERNRWFSNIWTDLPGASQKLFNSKIREKSGSFPFELAYRLINMFTIRETDTVLDPFLGTGTTTLASILLGRNSIGYELESNFKEIIEDKLNDKSLLQQSKKLVKERIQSHLEFQKNREIAGKLLKYKSDNYKFDVMSRQEMNIRFPVLTSSNHITQKNNGYDQIKIDCDYNFDIE